MTQRVKNLPVMQESKETWVWSLGQEDALKKEMAENLAGGNLIFSFISVESFFFFFFLMVVELFLFFFPWVWLFLSQWSPANKNKAEKKNLF